MSSPNDVPEELTCEHCASGAGLPFAFSFAFQPIVDVDSRRIFSYEALVRVENGNSAGDGLQGVDRAVRYRFDQACRVKAVKLAAALGIDTFLNINFMPNAVYQPRLCIRSTLAAAREYGFPIDRIMFEVIESEQVADHDHLRSIISEYQAQGFSTDLDDFGAGHAKLNLLADYQPNFIKLDMRLVRGIDRDKARQAIIKGIVGVCESLNITLIAEGVETDNEWKWLRDAGIALFQGYYFAKPEFEALPVVPQERYA